MSLMSVTAVYQQYTPADKEALKALRAEMAAKTGQDVSLADAIAAVEPEAVTPEYLRVC